MIDTIANLYRDGIKIRQTLGECLLTIDEINGLKAKNDQRRRTLLTSPQPATQLALKIEAEIALTERQIESLFKPFQDVRCEIERWSVRCWDGLSETPRVREGLSQRLESLMQWRSPRGLSLLYREADQVLGLLCEDFRDHLEPSDAAIAKFEAQRRGRPVTAGITHGARLKKLFEYLKTADRSKASLYRSLKIDKSDYYRWEKQDPRLTPGIRDRLDQFVDGLAG